MWKKFKFKLVVMLFIYASLNWPTTNVYAAEMSRAEFDQQSWGKLVRQSGAANIVVFTTTDCSHCPAVIEYLSHAVKKFSGTGGNKPALHIVVMDELDESDALQHGHYLLADKLWVFQGDRRVLQYSVNPKWRGLTPYVALIKRNQAEFVIGKPEPEKLTQFLQ